MLPLVSIITPCYNAVPFIAQTIESVLTQTYPSWEMLIVDDSSTARSAEIIQTYVKLDIVDDCSSDDSLSIIQKYARIDSRIRYLRTDKPSGSPTLPRNMGIKEAKGRYIAFLDSDDIWLPNKLSDQLKVFEKSEVAIVFSNYEKVSLGGERCGREVIAPCEVDYRLLLKGNCIGCLTAMYDSALTGKIFFKEVGPEDYGCWLFILKKGTKSQKTNTVTALYRVSDHSVSSNKLKAMRWQWNILRNEMDLPVYKAVYYFIHYAIRAFAKAMR